jgi:hypothetical protein
MKWCDQYEIKKSKKSAALGRLPKAAATTAAVLPVQSIPLAEAPDLSAPLRELVKSMSEFPMKQPAPQTPQQRRREIVQLAKTQVIDRYRTSAGQVAASMRGSAKLAIERELAPMPLEELPFEEVLEIAAAIRDDCYAPAFTRQARKAECSDAKKEAHRRAELEALGNLRRADRRKKVLVQQASNQACAYCQEKGIIGVRQLSVVGDVEAALGELLSGDEAITEAQAIVQSVLEARLAEAEATRAAAQSKEDEKWQEDLVGLFVLGALVAAPLLAAWYPTQTVAIFNWLEQTFGYTPGAEAAAPTPEAAETTPPAASAEVRPPIKRRRKDPIAPPGPESSWGNAVGGEPAHA